VLFPNLFPYDDVSAIAAMCREHFLPMDAMPEQPIRDALTVARDFFALTRERVEGGRAFGLVTWNYMPPAGATQVHPHMQVVLTASPGNAPVRELQAEAAFLHRHGRGYAEVLLETEIAQGERYLGATGAVSWLVPYVPAGLFGDCTALFPGRETLSELSDADIADFARGLVRVLRAFSGRGLWSFNLGFSPARFGERDGSHMLSARLLPRFYLNPRLHVSDASYVQLMLEERFAMIYPEKTAALLRTAFTDR
jgi:galactose-1-phosphate uridylyltransferase